MRVLYEDEYMRVELTKDKSVRTTVIHGNKAGPCSDTHIRVGDGDRREIFVTAADRDTRIEPSVFQVHSIRKPAIRLFEE